MVHVDEDVATNVVRAEPLHGGNAEDELVADEEAEAAATAHTSPQGPTRAQGRAQGPGEGPGEGPPGPDARAKRALDSSIYIYIYITTRFRYTSK